LKKLTKVVIGAFVGPFILVFLIWMVILDMQFLWLYIDDLMGKGLEWYIILELLFYASANWVPIALPLSVLLASIMTFGNLAEHNELTAMKAAGLSLFKIMKPLMVFMLFISAGAFYFSNNLWPTANFKMRVLIYDIQQTKAAIIFKEGIFFDELEDYNIRIGKKEKDGIFKDLLIYDYSEMSFSQNYSEDPRDYKRIISAKKGSITHPKNSSFMLLDLYDGFIFQEFNPKSVEDSKLPFMRYYFEKATLKIKLKSFDFERSTEETYTRDEHFLSLSQLKKLRDSAIVSRVKTNTSQYNITRNKFSITRGIDDSTDVNYDSIVATNNYFQKLDSVSKKQNILRAIELTRSLVNSQKVPVALRESSEKYITRKDISWHQKFTLSYACMMLLILGSSLGAIVKKGGIGIPVLIGIVLFLFYFIFTRAGEELAIDLALSPVVGMWLSAIILTPITIFVFFKANNDSKLFDMDSYVKFFQRLRRK
jgi:lipopolysaccharide export system permease protein